jgi:hypothetical protein
MDNGLYTYIYIIIRILKECCRDIDSEEISNKENIFFIIGDTYSCISYVPLVTDTQHNAVDNPTLSFPVTGLLINTLDINLSLDITAKTSGRFFSTYKIK